MAKIKRFGIIKTACFMGIYGFFIGVIGVLFTMVLIIIISGNLSDISSTFLPSLGSGLLSVILLPIIYGVVFFLIGLVFTPLMNLILKMINGLDWDIEIQQETSPIPMQNLEYSQGPPRQY